MSKTITLLIGSVFGIYIIGYYTMTDKYNVLFLTNECRVVRVVSHEWQKQIFSIAHQIEKALLGQVREATTMYVDNESEELRESFSGQLCNISNGKEVGS